MLAGTWTSLANSAPSGTGTMMLLTDGTAMVQGGGVTKTWHRLTPNAAGNYVNGTWGPLASMGLERLYFASNVLPDGRVFIEGGEYSGSRGQANWIRTGEIYDPVADSWRSIRSFPLSSFGDDPSQLLPNGRVLAGYLGGAQTYIYDPASDSWTFAANKLRGDSSDEETWIKLSDDSILSYDVFNNGHAQRYVPSQNQWVDAGNVPVALSGPQVGYELGPAFRLPDGRAFFIGANGNSASYTLSTNTWTTGPVVPNGLGADDAPGAVLPNGKVLFAADHFNPLFTGPTTIFEFDPTTNTYTNVTPPSSVISLGGPAFVCRMLVLPSGQVLVTSGGSRLAVYTPDGSPNSSWKPTISQVNRNGDGSYTLTGTQLNGISQGASFGDDAEMDSNYPIIRLTDDYGNVFYARTFSWSSTGVATGNMPVSTRFSLPSAIHAGHYSLSVIANGIASDPVGFLTNVAPSAPIAWGWNSFGQTTVPVGLVNVVAVAAGEYHSLAVKSDGTVVAWGDNSGGQTSVPTGLTNVVAVAAGFKHSLAVKSDGTVAAWGKNDRGQTSVPAGLTNVVAVAAGAQHSLALKHDGTVVAWGDNFFGETTVPAGLANVVAIAAGWYHSLALKSDGTVDAWGYNGEGETRVPAGLTNVVAIAAGDFDSLALKSDGAVVG